MSRHWTVRKQIGDVPRGTILKQIGDKSIEVSVRSTLSLLRRNTPNTRFVVCNYRDKQIILRVGRDVIPHSVGVLPTK